MIDWTMCICRKMTKPLTAMHAFRHLNSRVLPSLGILHMPAGGSGAMSHGGPGGHKRSLPSSALGTSKRQNLNVFAPHGALPAPLDVYKRSMPLLLVTHHNYPLLPCIAVS